MDSLAGSDDEQRFFEGYEVEPARNEATRPLSVFDAEEPQPPSEEQLAHLTRFRKPVAWLVSTLGLFSLVALLAVERPGSERVLVAHYGSALPARPPTPKTSPAPTPKTSPAPEISEPVAIAPQSDPRSESSFVSALVASLPVCWRDLPSEQGASFSAGSPIPTVADLPRWTFPGCELQCASSERPH